jgi:cell division protein ZapA
VGDRSYRIKVEARHEEMVRKTARLIQEKIQELKQQFVGQDMQDYVSMALIWFSTQNAREVHGQMLDRELIEGFDRLNQLADKAIAQAETRL